jgi:hypothetical protein
VSPSTASTSESSGDNISSSLTGVIKKAMKAGVNSDDDEFVEPPQSTDTLGTSEKAEADKMLTEVRSMNISPSNDSSRDSVSEVSYCLSRKKKKVCTVG